MENQEAKEEKKKGTGGETCFPGRKTIMTNAPENRWTVVYFYDSISLRRNADGESRSGTDAAQPRGYTGKQGKPDNFSIYLFIYIFFYIIKNVVGCEDATSS